MERIAALRAQWLARLSDAIDDAQRVAWQLRTSDSVSKEARELYSRLEDARIEVESLRGLSERGLRGADPDWLGKLGWSTSLDPPD
ncbi:MAG: hypothetical protein H0W39_10035 [Sphingomonas sp.]|nr:hypothetical protein [Sphingomonas sp.]